MVGQPTTGTHGVFLRVVGLANPVQLAVILLEYISSPATRKLERKLVIICNDRPHLTSTNGPARNVLMILESESKYYEMYGVEAWI